MRGKLFHKPGAFLVFFFRAVIPLVTLTVLLLEMLGRAPVLGAVLQTGLATDLALEGRGFFVVRNVQFDSLFVTRHGSFRLDQLGYVVDPSGNRLQGVVAGAPGFLQDLSVDGSARPLNADPLAMLISFEFDAEGRLQVRLSDGTEYVGGQIALQDFQRPTTLIPRGNLIFLWSDTSGALPSPGVAGELGLGPIRSGALEFGTEMRLRIRPSPEAVDPFRTGLITYTARVMDLALDGPGFFLVRDPATAAVSATRVGSFWVDADGYLLTQAGKRVQGIEAGAEAMVDVRVTAEGRPMPADPNAVVTSHDVDWHGSLRLRLSDGVEFVRARLVLQDFLHPQRLEPSGDSLFGNLTEAGPRFAFGEAGCDGLGIIIAGALDLDLMDDRTLAFRHSRRVFTQGALLRSAAATDVAIVGAGFFVLRDAGTGERFLTRCGHFERSMEGFLSWNGLRVQGYSDPALSQVGDVRIDAMGQPLPGGGSMAGFGLDAEGRILVTLFDGNHFVRGQVLLQNVQRPDALVATQEGLLREVPVIADLLALPGVGRELWGDTLYGGVDSARPTALAAPGIGGFGQVWSGALELPPRPEGPVLVQPKSGTTVQLEPMFVPLWPGDLSIEYSEDLQTWTSLGRPIDSLWGPVLTDPTPTASPARSYRARLEAVSPVR